MERAGVGALEIQLTVGAVGESDRADDKLQRERGPSIPWHWQLAHRLLASLIIRQPNRDLGFPFRLIRLVGWVGEEGLERAPNPSPFFASHLSHTMPCSAAQSSSALFAVIPFITPVYTSDAYRPAGRTPAETRSIA